MTSAAAQLPLFLSTLPFIPHYIEEATGPMMIGHTSLHNALFQLLQLLVLPAYAALWFTARPVGRLIAKPLSKTPAQFAIEGVTLLIIGTALIGLYIIALYIPTFIQEGGRWLLTAAGLWQPDPNERWIPRPIHRPLCRSRRVPERLPHRCSCEVSALGRSTERLASTPLGEAKRDPEARPMAVFGDAGAVIQGQARAMNFRYGLDQGQAQPDAGLGAALFKADRKSVV